MKNKLLTLALMLSLLVVATAASAADLAIYVANRGSSTVSVIDPATDTVTATIPVGAQPEHIAILPNGSAIYVTNAEAGTISVIDPSSNTVTTTIDLPDDDVPNNIAASPDSAHVYVSTNALEVLEIQTSDNTIVDTFDVFNTPKGMAVTPDGNTLYVANNAAAIISGIDLETGTVGEVAMTWAGIDQPEEIILNNDGTVGYISAYNVGTIYAFNTATNTHYDVDPETAGTQNITVGTNPLGLAITDTGLFVVNSGDNTIKAISLATHEVERTINVGRSPRYAVVNADESKLYVTEYYDNTVGVVSSSSYIRTSGITVGDAPMGIAVLQSMPNIDVSNVAVDFTSTTVGSTSAAQTVTVTSSGSEDLLISNIATTGDFAQTNDCPAALEPDDTCTISLTFTPTVSGHRTGTLTITSNAGSSPTTVALTGTGVSASGSTTSSLTAIFHTNLDKVVEDRRKAVSGTSFFYLLDVTNTGSESLGASTVTIELEVLRPYYAISDEGNIYIQSGLIEYNTEGTTLNTYTCAATQVSLVNPILTCDTGVVSTEQTRHFKLQVVAYTLDTQYHAHFEATSTHAAEDLDWTGSAWSARADIDSVATVVSGSLTASDYEDVTVSGFLRAMFGCSLLDFGADAGPINAAPLFIVFVLPLVVILVLRSRRAGLSLLVLFCLALPFTAQAETDHASLIPNVPVLGEPGLVYTLSASPAEERFHFGFDTRYGYRYIVDGLTDTTMIRSILVHDVAFGMALEDRFVFNVIVPFVSLNEIRSGTDYNNEYGIGDVMLRANINVWESQNGKSALSFIPFLSIPTGDEDDFISNNEGAGGVKIAMDNKIGEHWCTMFNLGFEAGEKIVIANYERQGRLLASAGVAFDATDQLKFLVDIISETSLAHPLQTEDNTSVEVMGGAQYAIKNTPLVLNANAGRAVVSSLITPSLQAQLGLAVRFGNHQERLTQEERNQLQPVLYFATDSAQIAYKDKTKLNQVSELLKQHKDVRLIIAEGHTDATGTHSYNTVLSTKRAVSVKTYLVNHGVEPSRIDVKAFAETRPANIGGARANEAINRRVELHLK